ncbi:hypothetical protein [Haloplanus halophilus]|uniref:hypothetical protein n=1 Tax=Haloplanus halophilus TaxID=2949993 RepID=UPI00204193A9|nr:hypothetical protein [Haloplanus sp. GDY1]
MSTHPILDDESNSSTAVSGDADPVDRAPPADRLDRHLRDRGVAVASRELATALGKLDDLSPAERRIVAAMAGRIAAGVLAPAREAVDGADRPPVSAAAVERLFLSDEHVRDEG